jgi:hypothetical protein
LLSIESCGLDAFVDDGDHAVEHWDNGKYTGAPHALKLTHPQDYELLPDVGNFDGRRNQKRSCDQDDPQIEMTQVSGSNCAGNQNKRQERSDWIHRRSIVGYQGIRSCFGSSVMLILDIANSPYRHRTISSVHYRTQVQSNSVKERSLGRLRPKTTSWA